MELYWLIFELLLPVTFAMDPALLRVQTARALRLHDEFRLLSRQSRSADRVAHAAVRDFFNAPSDLGDSSRVGDDSSLPLSKSNSDDSDITWRRSSTSLELSIRSNSNSQPNANSSLIKQTNSSTKPTHKQPSKLAGLFLRTGGHDETSGESEQARHPRQTLQFQVLYRQMCSSSLISSYMTMTPDTKQAEFKLMGGSSTDSYGVFGVFKYKPNLYQFTNRKANRTVCVHSENGTLYTAPLQFLTYLDSHECLFERQSMCNRSWCLSFDLPVDCVNSNIYITTKGPKRALAMRASSGRNPRLDVITAPWSESGGLVEGCQPTFRGCYIWSEQSLSNCGVEDDTDCVTYSTTKATPRVPIKTKSSTSTTTTTTTVTTTTSVTTTAVSTTNRAANTSHRQDLRCAINYCRSRAELFRKHHHDMSPDDVARCRDEFMSKMRQIGENFRNVLCVQQGYGTTRPSVVTNDNVLGFSSTSSQAPRLLSTESPYSFIQPLTDSSSNPEDVAASRSSDLREPYREKDGAVPQTKPTNLPDLTALPTR